MNHRDGMNLSEKKVIRGEKAGGLLLEMAKDGVHFGVSCLLHVLHCLYAAHQEANL